MASKLVKGLYFAGEILDLDAVTGGYNLQIAWSTAYLAGSVCGRSNHRVKGMRIMSINVAIDGPAGAGKSTIAKKLAKELDYIYVDTGAMYRAMALYMIEKKTDIQHMDAVRSACDAITIDIRYSDGEQQVILNGRNVNDFIRTEAVSEMSSKISAIPEVRAKTAFSAALSGSCIKCHYGWQRYRNAMFYRMRM